jgi:hypothetical protein
MYLFLLFPVLRPNQVYRPKRARAVEMEKMNLLIPILLINTSVEKQVHFLFAGLPWFYILMYLLRVARLIAFLENRYISCASKTGTFPARFPRCLEGSA